jgi:phosphonate transport system substrate-binding protein
VSGAGKKIEKTLTIFHNIRNILLFILIFPLAAPAAEDAAASQYPPLVFGFLPILSAERLVTRFSPLVDYLSRRSGRDIRMETAPDFAEFIRRTRDGQRYAILFTAPHLFYLAAHDSGYRPLVRVDRPGMKAVVVVPLDSDIRDRGDLRGRSLATTGPLALSTLLIRDLLTGDGLDPDRDLRLVPTPNHIAALLSARQGTTDASAVMLPVFRHAQPQLRASMRIVAHTVEVPHIPIGVASWVDTDTGDRLQTLLTGMRHDPQGREVLRQLDWPGFVPVGPQVYDGLRRLAEQVEVD